MTATDAGLMPFVTQLGRARSSVMDVPVVLASLCSTMPAMLGIAGAAILLTESAQGTRAPAASDARATWFGEVQQRTGSGPLPAVLHSGRPLLTPDLRRSGPPPFSAAAAESGFVSSLVLPIEVDGDRIGALQLLGDAQRPVQAALGDILRPLLEVLAARLIDFCALERASTASRPSSGAPERPSPARTVAAEQAVPSQRVAQSGAVPSVNRGGEATPSGRRWRSRNGSAHSATNGAAEVLDSTTHALPAVSAPRRQSNAEQVPQQPVAPRRQPTPRADRPRSGRHSA